MLFSPAMTVCRERRFDARNGRRAFFGIECAGAVIDHDRDRKGRARRRQIASHTLSVTIASGPPDRRFAALPQCGARMSQSQGEQCGGRGDGGPGEAFLSRVSDEFRDYRDPLRKRADAAQRRSQDSGGFQVPRRRHARHARRLYRAMRICRAFRRRHGRVDAPWARGRRAARRNIQISLPTCRRTAMRCATTLDSLTYTQWEAWLAIYQRRIFLDRRGRPKSRSRTEFRADGRFARRAAAHLARLKATGRDPGRRIHRRRRSRQAVFESAILDLLVKAGLAIPPRRRDEPAARLARGPVQGA